jgi:hypothetical protein
MNTELRFEAFPPGNGAPIQGVGQAENMSSMGLAFRSETPLECGSRVSVSLAWPARLDNQCLLRMVFEGDVVRCEDGLVVLTIERYEFRTSGRSNSAARQEIAAMAHSLEMHLPAKGMERNTWAKRTTPISA